MPDDRAPPARKYMWLGMMYQCAPLGFALGYIIGGSIAAASNWRVPFFVDAALMVPIVAWCCFAPPLELKASRACECV